jgi:hypothetical protein
MPCRRQTARRSAPSAPTPEVITTRARTPRRPHACATSFTAATGTVSTARSTGSGRSAAAGTQEMPSMAWPCGLTAYTRPANPLATRLCRMARPTVRGRRLAPITATDSGASTDRRLATSARLSRLATDSR